jgi:hypothetical protein
VPLRIRDPRDPHHHVALTLGDKGVTTPLATSLPHPFVLHSPSESSLGKARTLTAGRRGGGGAFLSSGGRTPSSSGGGSHDDSVRCQGPMGRDERCASDENSCLSSVRASWDDACGCHFPRLRRYLGVPVSILISLGVVSRWKPRFVEPVDDGGIFDVVSLLEASYLKQNLEAHVIIYDVLLCCLLPP